MDLFFQLFVFFDFHCNKISLFSITIRQVLVNVISTSCDFCLKTISYFFFLYLMLHKLLFQKVSNGMFYLVELHRCYEAIYLILVMFYEGRENIQQFKYVRFLFVFINMRKSMEQGEVSALFQEKRKKNR